MKRGSFGARPDQIFPSNARMMIIKRIRPNPPLGAYPHPRLCRQEGTDPTNIRTRTINKIVPRVLIFFGVWDQLEPKASY